MRQIADNLIDNAIKYTPEDGSVPRQLPDPEGRDRRGGCRHRHRDSPRRPAPDLRAFYRVDKARSRELGGTGLGLSIVKHLVQSIGGQLELTSRLGSGSKFTVLFPRGKPSGATPADERLRKVEGRGTS